MKVTLVVSYLVVAFLHACWMDAMDNRYVINDKGQHAGWATETAISLLWPVFVPVTYAAMALTDNGGRWKFVAKGG